MSADHAVSFPAPADEDFNVLLRTKDGQYLALLEDGSIEPQGHVDDGAVWSEPAPPRLMNGGAEPLTIADEAEVLLHMATQTLVKPEDIDHAFTVVHGPAELPSVYLARFREQGWVVLPKVLNDGIVKEMQALAELPPDRTPPLCQGSVVARASTEPLSLWLMRVYMGTQDIRFAHTPAVQLLSKEDGLVQGWHSDFPYHWGIDDLVPTSPENEPQLCLGVQFDICMHDWTRDNGAEVLKLGSHSLNHGPPAEWGLAGGYRQGETELYEGEEACYVEAVAGSVVLYDARTWHHVGANSTDSVRGCLMNCVTPAFMLPLMDQSGPTSAFLDSDLSADLNERELAEVDNLMVCHTSTGAVLAMDREATRAANEKRGAARL